MQPNSLVTINYPVYQKTRKRGQFLKVEYDPNGNRKKVIDAEGKTTNYLFDERDLLYTVTDANTQVTTYGYDLNGNLSSIKDANTNTTSYLYDEFDRLKEMTYPDGTSKESYTYDPTSNLKTKTDPKSKTITYDYDELNRLTFKTYNGCSLSVCGGNVDYVYDAGSRLETVSNSLVTINYPVYDALNRVKQVTTTLNGTNYTVNYQYDTAGNRTQLTYPHGRIVKYTHDELNRIDQIKDSFDQVLYDFNHDLLSRRETLSRPNGITTSYAYDTLNRLTQIQHSSVATIGYPLYDKVGNRKQMTDSEGTRTYTYDNIYQLTSSVIASVSEAIYAYDPVGNRTSATETGTPSSYTPNNLNQYTSVDSTSFTYDLNGNLTNDGIFTYTYDFENRLIQATPSPLAGEGQDGGSYTYDPFGRRLTKTVDSTVTTYLYDGDQIIETYPCNLISSTCSLSQSFLFGPGIDEPLELTDHPSLTKHYYHQDGLGSVTQISDSTGTLEESTTYSPYGIPEIRNASNTVIPESLIGNPYLFTGREYDPETGLYYYRSRNYSPTLGRFLERDSMTWGPNDFRVLEFSNTFPIALVSMISARKLISQTLIQRRLFLNPGTENGWLDQLYTYSYNNPINFVDPYGFWGFGGTIDATGEVGASQLGGAAAGTASAGGGVFVGSTSASIGGYVSYGGFVNSGGATPPSQPRPTQTATGAYVGVGGGFFFTNASSAQDLNRTTSTTSLDIFLGSIQVSQGDGIWIVSITAGPGAGFGTSTVDTTTEGNTFLGGIGPGGEKK